MTADIVLLDNNVIRKLEHRESIAKLRSNLRITGREFWPSAVNVLEALKSRDPATRTRLLATLESLAGDNHALPLPTEVLRLSAQAHATQSKTIVWSEPRLTYVFREPGEVSDEQAAVVRAHLHEQEGIFDKAHERAREELLPLIREDGGRERWPDVGSFLDEVWNSPTHIERYVVRLWEEWGFAGTAPVGELLEHRVWKLYFEGWGAAMYARIVAHPRPPKVESSDLAQLIYGGGARSMLLVSDDKGFASLANSFLKRSHPMLEVVPLSAMLT